MDGFVIGVMCGLNLRIARLPSPAAGTQHMVAVSDGHQRLILSAGADLRRAASANTGVGVPPISTTWNVMLVLDWLDWMLKVWLPTCTVTAAVDPPVVEGVGRFTVVPATFGEPVGTTIVSLFCTAICAAAPVVSISTRLWSLPDTTTIPFFKETTGWPVWVAVSVAVPLLTVTVVTGCVDPGKVTC